MAIVPAMPVLVEKPAAHPHVAVVTIDRPERANSLNPAALRELAAAWRSVAADDDVRAVVLTGAGERVFCSGMDLRETIPAAQALARGETIDPGDFEGLRSVGTATLAAFDLGKPLVAAVNGHCRGGGFDLMLASEMRVSVPEATFALEVFPQVPPPAGLIRILLAAEHRYSESPPASSKWHRVRLPARRRKMGCESAAAALARRAEERQRRTHCHAATR